MASIFRFNQSGVGSDVQYGRQGGHVAYDKTNKRFKISDKASADSSAVQRFIDFDPVNHSDNSLATIKYVKDVIQGMRTKKSVRVASVANLDLTTVHMDAAAPTESLPSIIIDSRTIAVGERVLLKDQTDAKENGIYQIYEVDDAGTTKYYFGRTDDFDVHTEVEGAYVFVESGTATIAGGATNEGTGWVGSVVGVPDNTADIGTVEITFAQFHGTGSIQGITERGIKVEGNDISMYWEDVDSTSAVTYADTMMFKGATATAFKTATVADALNVDLNIFNHKMVDKSGNTGIHVAADNSSNGTVINFNVDKNASHDVKASVFAIGADLIKTEFADPLADGTVGSRVEINAGSGRASKGGNVTLTGGAGNGVNQDGGDVVFTPGPAGSGTGQLGKVKVTGAGSFGLPVGVETSRPSNAEAGMIRINTTTITDNDVLEIYNAQQNRWDLIQGAGFQIEDFDKDTKISVSSGPTADTDIITMTVGQGTNCEAGDVFEASADFINIIGQPSIDDTKDGAEISIESGEGKSGGDISIISGDSTGTDGSDHAGDITIRAGAGANAGGHIKFGTSDVTGDATPGDVVIICGNAGTKPGGKLEMDSGTGTGDSIINIGETNASVMRLGNASTEHTILGKKLDLCATGTVTEINIGSSSSTAVTHVEGKKLELFAGTADANDQLNMKANTINMGTDTDNVNINIGNGAADVVVSADDLTLTGDNSLELSCTLADRDVNVTTSGEGVLHVMNTNYENQVTDDNDIPNRKFVADAFINGTFGGVGFRAFEIDKATVGDGSQVLGTLPAGARIKSISVDVYEAFSWATTGHEMKLTTGAGAFTDICPGTDTDIETVGVYKVEHSARQTSDGNVTIDFFKGATPSTPSTATTGKMFITIEFISIPTTP